MPAKTIKTLEVRTRREWRKWFGEHHDSDSEIWLIFHKRHTGVSALTHDDAVEEALCYGWIDSIIRRLDDSRYARKFTPRKTDFKWSAANRRRYADLELRGLLAAPGLNRGQPRTMACFWKTSARRKSWRKSARSRLHR